MYSNGHNEHAIGRARRAGLHRRLQGSQLQAHYACDGNQIFACTIGFGRVREIGGADEACQVEGLLGESVPNSQSNHLQLAQVDTQKLAELLGALPQALHAKTAELRLACSNHDTQMSKIR